MSKIKFRNRAELSAALESGAFEGRALHLLVLHDDECTPEHCSCEPEFVVEDLTAENYIAGQRAQAEWARTSRS